MISTVKDIQICDSDERMSTTKVNHGIEMNFAENTEITTRTKESFIDMISLDARVQSNMKKSGRKTAIFNLPENVKFFDSICEGHISFFATGFALPSTPAIPSEEEHPRYIMSLHTYPKFELLMWITCSTFSGDAE